MRFRIQKSMILIFSTLLLFSYVFLSVLIYNQNLDFLKNTVRQEAELLALSINLLDLGDDYIAGLDGVNEDTRVTHIDGEGRVTYDSMGIEDYNPTHSQRQEVIEALETGRGEVIRNSETTGQRMYYYALLLEDGTILRVSRTMESIISVALRILPMILFIFLGLLFLSWLLSRIHTARLLRPIMELDLEEPLKGKSYEELMPLLEAMDQKNRERAQIEEMRKEFSANVSHELKTPLTSISGYAEIMMNGLVESENVEKFSQRIFKEARRLLTLIDDTIKISRLDEGRLEAEKKDVDLYDLCREIISRLAPQADAKKVRIILTGEQVTIKGIGQLLDEMLYNLCENAIKYNHQKGRVTVWVGKTLEGVKVSVSDTGIGIPKEDFERIFERFYRVDKSHSKETGGTGLGLSIVKHVALLHQAKVSVESKLGYGAKIEINFG